MRNDDSALSFAIALLPVLLAGACTDPSAFIPPENPGAMVDVNGTYDYSGNGPAFGLFGTITFQQAGDTVQVVGTTYANAPNDRSLMGQADLTGNRLDIVLVPVNGDMDFEAQVTFVFTEDGENFVVSFSDTNGDQGGLGSYSGRRRAP